MKEHIIPSIVASVVAAGASLGLIHTMVKPVTVNTVASKPVSDRHAELLAKSIWPEMAQSDIDGLTTAVEHLPGDHRVTIYCVEDKVCGDIALNLDDAFESAHWQSNVIDYPMIQPGIMTGSAELKEALTMAGFKDVRIDDSVRAANGLAIAIGNLYQP